MRLHARCPRPDTTTDNIALARILHRERRLDEAVRICSDILRRNSANVDALILLGTIRQQQQRGDEAHWLLKAALSHIDCDLERENADPAQLLNQRGKTLHYLGRYFEALVSYDKAIAASPNEAELHLNRGIALYYLGRYKAAVASYDKADQLSPGDAGCLLRRGVALHKLNDYDRALANFDEALRIEPDNPFVHNARGETLACQTRYQDALAAFERAAACDHDFIQPRWNIAVTRILHGDYRRGWQEYECRWLNPLARPRKFTAPLWLGDAPLDGKTILLHAEQGFGDTIQFVRYAPLLAARGAKVLVEVQADLRALISRMTGIAAVFAQPKQQTEDGRIDGAPVQLPRQARFPRFDYHCPMMSLPLAFKTELDSVPASESYLSADDTLTAHWQERLPEGHARVGIAWAGNPHHWEDRNRSIALTRLLPLLSAPCSFVSLQKSATTAEMSILARLDNVVHFGEELSDFDDTAAVIASLDLVVTVDTAVAHLAAAMGKPVWILLAHAPEWRWLLHRSDSPWYPTVRLFRQQQLDGWAPVVEQIRVELGSWLESRA